MRYLLILSKHARLTILKFFPTLITLLLHPARLTLPLNFSTLLANSFYKFENFANAKKERKIHSKSLGGNFKSRLH